jgi:hypothetical protein
MPSHVRCMAVFTDGPSLTSHGLRQSLGKKHFMTSGAVSKYRAFAPASCSEDFDRTHVHEVHFDSFRSRDPQAQGDVKRQTPDDPAKPLVTRLSGPASTWSRPYRSKPNHKAIDVTPTLHIAYISARGSFVGNFESEDYRVSISGLITVGNTPPKTASVTIRDKTRL